MVLKIMYSNEFWILIDEKVELLLKYELILMDLIVNLVRKNLRERCVSRS